jgi:Ca-activated chloride channel family protein
MRSHTYSKFSPEAADAVDLQSLLGKLADFLLQSGFAGSQQFDPWGDFNEESDRSLEALKQAILDALIESGQFTPELLEALRGDGDEDSEEKLAQLLDDLVQRLAAEPGPAALRTQRRNQCSSISPTRQSTSSATSRFARY